MYFCRQRLAVAQTVAEVREAWGRTRCPRPPRSPGRTPSPGWPRRSPRSSLGGRRPDAPSARPRGDPAAGILKKNPSAREPSLTRTRRRPASGTERSSCVENLPRRPVRSLATCTPPTLMRTRRRDRETRAPRGGGWLPAALAPGVQRMRLPVREATSPTRGWFEARKRCERGSRCAGPASRDDPQPAAVARETVNDALNDPRRLVRALATTVAAGADRDPIAFSEASPHDGQPALPAPPEAGLSVTLLSAPAVSGARLREKCQADHGADGDGKAMIPRDATPRGPGSFPADTTSTSLPFKAAGLMPAGTDPTPLCMLCCKSPRSGRKIASCARRPPGELGFTQRRSGAGTPRDMRGVRASR